MTGQVLLARDDGTALLYLACAVVGLSDGVMWSLSPLYVDRDCYFSRLAYTDHPLHPPPITGHPLRPLPLP